MNFKLFFLSTALCLNAYGCNEQRCSDSFLNKARKSEYIIEKDDHVTFNIFKNIQVRRFTKESKNLIKAHKAILRDMLNIVRTFDDANEFVRVEMSNRCGSFYAFNADYKTDALNALNIDKQHMTNYVDQLYSRESWEIYDENRKKTYWEIARDFSWYWGDDNKLLTYSKFVDGPYLCGVDFAREELKNRILKGEYNFEENWLLLELLSYSLGMRILILSEGDKVQDITLQDADFSSIHLIGILGDRYKTIQEIQDTGLIKNKGTLYIHYNRDKKPWRAIPVEHEQPYTYGCDLCYDNFQQALEAQKTKKYDFSLKNLYKTIEEFLFDQEDDDQ